MSEKIPLELVSTIIQNTAEIRYQKYAKINTQIKQVSRWSKSNICRYLTQNRENIPWSILVKNNNGYSCRNQRNSYEILSMLSANMFQRSPLTGFHDKEIEFCSAVVKQFKSRYPYKKDFGEELWSPQFTVEEFEYFCELCATVYKNLI